MLSDFKIIKNFFEEPDKIRALALSQAFHTFEQEYGFVKNNRRFPGRRTENLFNILDKSVYVELMNEFYKKLIIDNIRDNAVINYNINGFPLFHSLYSGDKDLGDSGLHRDSTIYAAVVYLNTPPDDGDYGTRLIKDGVDFSVPYEYNSCVMYRGDYLHGAVAGFGDTIESSRLSMNFFISDIDLSLHSPTPSL